MVEFQKWLITSQNYGGRTHIDYVPIYPDPNLIAIHEGLVVVAAAVVVVAAPGRRPQPESQSQKSTRPFLRFRI